MTRAPQDVPQMLDRIGDYSVVSQIALSGQARYKLIYVAFTSLVKPTNYTPSKSTRLAPASAKPTTTRSTPSCGSTAGALCLWKNAFLALTYLLSQDALQVCVTSLWCPTFVGETSWSGCWLTIKLPINPVDIWHFNWFPVSDIWRANRFCTGTSRPKTSSLEMTICLY